MNSSQKKLTSVLFAKKIGQVFTGQIPASDLVGSYTHLSSLAQFLFLPVILLMTILCIAPFRFLLLLVFSRHFRKIFVERWYGRNACFETELYYQIPDEVGQDKTEFSKKVLIQEVRVIHAKQNWLSLIILWRTPILDLPQKEQKLNVGTPGQEGSLNCWEIRVHRRKVFLVQRTDEIFLEVWEGKPYFIWPLNKEVKGYFVVGWKETK
ncbi:MAG TPA: hypothetical protein VFM02_01695 [Candidatus Paceibacterota bacterium]|nr:hypothetical protein [Candidatus Paceibacterota bacterium]